MNDSRRSMQLMMAFVALWAAEEALTALVIGRYGLVEVVWWRFVLHLALMAVLWGPRQAATLWRTRRPVFQMARAAMMVGMPICWALGVRSGVKPDLLMSVFWLSPLIILGLAHLFMHERVSRKVWLAAVGACVGVFALTGPHAMPHWPLLVFPLGMAMCFGLYVVMTRSLRTEHVGTNLFYTGLGVSLMLTPLLPQSWVTPSAPDLVVLAGVALLGLGALFALERLAAIGPVSDSAPLAYLQIPFAMGIAWSLEQYDPTLRTLIGMLAIGAAALYVWRHAPRRVAQMASDTGHGGLD
ncbi:MAG: DMT family transporter [Rhizobacter sp.]